MKKENDYYIDNQGNKWSISLETEESAQKKSKSLINCKDCRDCSSCSYCSSCSDCSSCNGCSYCRGCSYCSSCSDCRGCSSCSFCSSCSDCSSCRDCSSCSYCSSCKDCSSCRGCSYCNGCSSCRDCSSCRGCSDFEENPQRYTTKKIGSRNDQTTVYWTDKKDLVVCGCFKGNLKTFKEKVIEVHKNSKFLKGYIKEICLMEYIINYY
jgi:hypothetical protein